MPHGDHDHDHSDVPSDVALRVKALEPILTEKGLVDPKALDIIVETYEHKVGSHLGARVIARAWSDPTFKARLTEDGSAAIAELGIAGPQGGHIQVVENTPAVHNLVVCTLCSCYPAAVLACHRLGTNPPPIAPAPSSTRAACSPSWGWRLPRTWKCGCGIPRPSSAIS